MTMLAERAETNTADREWSRHRGPVTGVMLIPGTSTAVTAAYDGAVGLFDLDSGHVELLGYHDHLVNRVVVNADGTRAASCSSDYTIHVWDLAGRRREHILLGHSDDVEDFAFVDHETGISASRDRRIIVWNLATGAIRRVLEGHEKDALAVVESGGKIYSSGDDKTLRVWDLHTGTLLKYWGPFDNETDTCAIDPKGDRAVLGCDDGCIRIFDAATGDLVRQIEAHRSGIKKVAISPKNGDILSAAYDQKIIVWDSQTFIPKLTLEKQPATWERSLTWSPDGGQILGGSFDGTVLIWDATTGEFEREVGRSGAEAGNPCFNDVTVVEPGVIATVSDDGIVRVGRLTRDEDRWVQKIQPRSGRILMNAVTASEEYGLLVAGAHNHTLFIFERTDDGFGEAVAVPLGEGPVNSVRIANQPGYESQTFVACYSSRILRVSRAGEIVGNIQVHEGAVKSLRLHPEKAIGVSCGADGLCLSWTFEGTLLERFLGHTAIINDVDLDPAGERVASVSRDFTVKVFDLASGRLQHSIPIGRKSLKSVCFLDQETVLIGDYWGGLIRVDLSSEKTRRSVVAANGISALARSGDQILATSYDGTIYLVNADLTVVRTLSAMRQRLTTSA